MLQWCAFCVSLLFDSLRRELFMSITPLLSALATYLELEQLSLDKNNVCLLSFNGNHELMIEPDVSGAYTHVYAVLGSIPVDKKLAFYEEIFKKNLFGRDTGLATLHCDMEKDELLLCQMFDHRNIHSDRFIALVTDFAGSVISHKDWLANQVFDAYAPSLSLCLAPNHHQIRV